MGSLRERECRPKYQWADQTDAGDTDEGAGSRRSRSRHPDFQRARIPRFGRSRCGLEDLRAICEVAYFTKSGARRDDSVEKKIEKRAHRRCGREKSMPNLSVPRKCTKL